MMLCDHLFPTNIISSVIEQLQHFEAVDITLPITDTIKTYDGQIVPRNQLYATQTPLGFHFDVILNLHKMLIKSILMIYLSI